MENKERQILSEIMDMMASVRSQLELLEAKVAELHQSVSQEDEDMAPIDLDLDDFVDDLPEAESEVETVEPETEDVAEPEAESEDVAEPLAEVEVFEPVAEAEEPVETEVEIQEAETVEPEAEMDEDEAEVEVVQPEEVDDDLPFFTEPEPEPVPEPVFEPEPVLEPEPVVEPVLEQKPVQAVIDSMTDRQAWRTDMPGSPVKDIRSAISLNDRILFINMLFGQDPMAFQDALTKINQLGTLDEAVQYIVAEHPEWDLGSETVYRFMMAVRRKIR